MRQPRHFEPAVRHMSERLYELATCDAEAVRDCYPSSAVIEDEFRRFFRDALKGSPTTLGNVAKLLNMGERNLQRILTGKYRLTTATLTELGQILEIDMGRAWLAIALFGDLKLYDDPTLIIAVDLIEPLVRNIRQDLPYPLEPLHPKATMQLSNWIAATVIENQRQLFARREELEIHRQF